MNKFLKILKPINPPSPKVTAAVTLSLVCLMTQGPEVLAADSLEGAVTEVQTKFKDYIVPGGLLIGAGYSTLAALFSDHGMRQILQTGAIVAIGTIMLGTIASMTIF